MRIHTFGSVEFTLLLYYINSQPLWCRQAEAKAVQSAADLSTERDQLKQEVHDLECSIDDQNSRITQVEGEKVQLMQRYQGLASFKEVSASTDEKFCSQVIYVSFKYI